MGKKIGIGIVGLGRAGNGMHLPDLAGKTDLFEIVAVCDEIASRREDIAAQLGCRAYARIEDLVADDAVELVDIATRSCDHFAHGMIALEAGKRVFMEKPMCIDDDQAKRLIDKARSLGADRLFVRHNRRFEANYDFIRDIQRNGLLGNVYEIQIARVSFGRRDDWQTLRQFGGGQLLNWGPHVVDQALGFIDRDIAMMQSDIRHTVAAGDCEDHVRVVLTGKNGVRVEGLISGGMAKGLPDYSVYGTRGALTIDGKGIHMRYIDPAQVLPEPVADPGTPGAAFGTTGTFAPSEELHWIEEDRPRLEQDLSVIWDHLYRAIREGVPFPVTLEESLQTMGVLSQVRRDAEARGGVARA